MKWLAVISAVCLALLLQTAVGQDDSAVVEADPASSNSTSPTASETTNSTAPDASSNTTTVDTGSSTNSSSSDTGSSTTNSSSTAESDAPAEGNSTAVVDDGSEEGSSAGNATVEVEAPSNMTAPSNIIAPSSNTTEPEDDSSSSNGTAPAGNATTSNQTESESAPVQNVFLNASTADMTMFAVSEDCADIVKSCYVENSADEFSQFLFCDAYEASSECVAENVTAGNDTQACTEADLMILQVFSCSTSNLSVPPMCKARVTQCAVSHVTPEEKMAGVDGMTFNKKVCDTLKAGSCLDMSDDGAVCSASEIAAIKGEVDCSGTAGLLSSALLLALMLVVTRVM